MNEEEKIIARKKAWLIPKINRQKAKANQKKRYAT